ncbi:hypothetical protein [Falsiroseomonas sp. HW251]|uniref:hypothetical protein n=1 Tax=Falsiroseomonas sp. HW251 TaxID=3390998 RepID=UPI003D31FC96
MRGIQHREVGFIHIVNPDVVWWKARVRRSASLAPASTLQATPADLTLTPFRIRMPIIAALWMQSTYLISYGRTRSGHPRRARKTVRSILPFCTVSFARQKAGLSLADASTLRAGRELATWIGLVPLSKKSTNAQRSCNQL